MISSLGPTTGTPELPKMRGRLQPLVVTFAPQALLEFTAARPPAAVPGCSCSFSSVSHETGSDGEEPVWRPEKRSYDAVLLVADLSGFTALASRLVAGGRDAAGAGGIAPPGSPLPGSNEDLDRRERQRWAADELSRRVNATTEAMLSVAARFEMDAVKFAGDAVTLMRRYGPDRGGAEEAARGALECALRMLREIEENPDFSLHCAMSMGHVVEAHLGTTQRRELVLLGQAVHEVSIGVPLSKAGQLAMPESLHLFLSRTSGIPFRPAEGGYRIVELAEAIRAGLCPAEDGPWSNVVSPARRYSDPWVGRCSACMEAALRPYLPPEALSLLSRGPSARMWAEIRPISAAFFQLPLATDEVEHSKEALDRLNACLRAVINAVEDTEGAFRSFSVDDKGAAAFATWGVENAHEDDSERAVMAALRVREALVAAGEAPPAVGVTTGRAYCGLVGSPARYDYSVLGDTINVACRLMSLSAGIVTDGPTASLLPSPPFLVSPLGNVALKGKKEPQAVFRVEGSRAVARTSTRMGSTASIPTGVPSPLSPNNAGSRSSSQRFRPSSIPIPPRSQPQAEAWRRTPSYGALDSPKASGGMSPVLRALHGGGSPLAGTRTAPSSIRMPSLVIGGRADEPGATDGSGAGGSWAIRSNPNSLRRMAAVPPPPADPPPVDGESPRNRRRPSRKRVASSWFPFEPTGTFVGRRHALQAFEDFVLSCDTLRPCLASTAPPPPMWQQLSDTPVPRVLLIEGESGCGKSALARAATAWLQGVSTVRVLVCAAPASQSPSSSSPRGNERSSIAHPFAPFRASLAEALGLQSLIASSAAAGADGEGSGPSTDAKVDEVLDASAPNSGGSTPRSSQRIPFLPPLVLAPSLWETGDEAAPMDPLQATENLRTVVKALVVLDPSLAIHAEVITAALGLSPPPPDSSAAAQLARMRSVLSSVLSLTIAREPTVLLLEDIHRFDPASLELLSDLRRLPNGPVAVVATARPEDGPLQLAHLRTEAATCVLHLGPLSEDETCGVLCAAMGITAQETAQPVASGSNGASPISTLPERWLAHVVQVQAGGNPGRALETLRLLLANRTIIVSKGRLKIFSVEGVAEVVDLAMEHGSASEEGLLSVAGPPPGPSERRQSLTMASASASPGSLPESFEKLIMSRLDAMTKESAMLCTLLAVFKGLFTANLAEDVCGPELELGYGQIRGRLGALVAGGWLAQRRVRSPSEVAAAGVESNPVTGDGPRSSRTSAMAFCFLHEATREVVYLRLMGDRRRELHGRAAKALEGMSWAEREALGVTPLDLAAHYKAAGDARGAVRHLTTAGVSAARSGALEAAVAALEGALELEPGRTAPGAVLAKRVDSLSPTEVRERVGRRVLLARVLRISGRLQDCRNVLDRVLEVWPESAPLCRVPPLRAGRPAGGAARLSLGTRRAILWARTVAAAPAASEPRGSIADAAALVAAAGSRWAGSAAERDAGAEVGLGGLDEDCRDEALAVYELAVRHSGDHASSAHAALLRWSLLTSNSQPARVAEAASRAALALDWLGFGGAIAAAASRHLRAVAVRTANRLPAAGRFLAHRAAVAEAEAQAHILGCRIEAGVTAAKEGVILARQFGRPSLTLGVQMLEPLALYYGGKLREAREATERLQWLASSLRSQPHACWAAILMALVQLASRAPADAIESLERATILAKTLGTAGRAPEGGAAVRPGPFVTDTGMLVERRAACALLAFAVSEATSEGTLAESALVASLDSTNCYVLPAARAGGIDPLLEAPAVCAVLEALARSHGRLGEELAGAPPEGLKRALVRRRSLRRRQFAAAYALLEDRAGFGAAMLAVPLDLYAAVREAEFRGRPRVAARMAERARAAARARGLVPWELRALELLHRLEPAAGHGERATLLVSAALA